jgi:surface-anchored protein
MQKRIFALLLAVPLAASAQTVLSSGPIEISINFVAAYVGTGTNPWLLGVRRDDVRVEIAGSISGSTGTERVILFANEQTRITVPDNPLFAPLGAPGASAWVLPDVPSTQVLAPGISTQNRTGFGTWTGEGVPPEFLAVGVPAGTFLLNRINLTLETFSGPGDFSLYRVSGFGDPTFSFRTDDGVTAADTRVVSTTSHTDLNWAFTAPGDYYLGFRASGTLLSGATTSSELTIFHFQVVPEPTTAALLLSALALAARRRRSGGFPTAEPTARAGGAHSLARRGPRHPHRLAQNGAPPARMVRSAVWKPPLRHALTALALGATALGHGTGGHPGTPAPKPSLPRALSLLDHGDVEGVGFAFVNGKWDLYIHDLLHGVEYDPGAAIVRVPDAARTQVPASASYSFLGAAGAPVWLLPQSQDEAANLGVVSLGHSAASIAAGTFTSDISLQLTALAFTPEPGVTGAGHFALFTNDALGVPSVLLDSRDGFSAADSTTIAAGGHRHFNWAFSAPGLYKLSYQVSATRTGSAAPVTDSQVFTCRVRSAGAPLTLWNLGETLVVDGAAARITALGLPAIHGATRAAVRATLYGAGLTAANNSAILLRAAGETTVLARTGATAPNLPGTRLRSLGDPALSSSGLASFVATLLIRAGGVTAANDALLLSQYAAPGGGTALGTVWRKGDAAPGTTGGRFTRLNWYFPSGDGFLLSAQATAGRALRNGVWRVSFTGGVPVLTLLILEGQPFLSDLALKTPRTIALPTSAPQPGGTARAIAGDGTTALLVVFTDGTREVVQFTPPPP